jgi:hypothetical protein
MSDEDQAIRKYYSLRPTDFTILLRLELQQLVFPDSTPDLVIEIELGTDDGDNRRLLLSFAGVRDARIQQPSLSLFDIPFIEICSIRDRQWEDLSYKVRCKEDLISFICRSFDAHIIPT